MPNMVEFAKAYRKKLGWSVMPVHHKRPLIPWKEFQKRLPTIEEIESWWADTPWANIGLITGRLSGVVVFDCDSEDALEHIKNKGIQTTPVAQSSEDYKRHYYFKYPRGSQRIIRNVNGMTLHKIGLDVRAEGGYVVIPPSVHKSGCTYQWLVSPCKVNFAEMDQWQIEYCFRKKRSGWKPTLRFGYKDPKWVTDALEGNVYEGARDNTTYALARYYSSRGFEYNDTLQRLLEWNTDKVTPSLHPRMIKKCVKSAYHV